MRAPILCWKCTLGILLFQAGHAWLYPPTLGFYMELDAFVVVGLLFVFSGQRLVEQWHARRILQEGRRVRPAGRTIIPASAGPIFRETLLPDGSIHRSLRPDILKKALAAVRKRSNEHCCQRHCENHPVASAKFGIVWDVIYHPRGSWIRETWGAQRLELARMLAAAAAKRHGGAA